MSNGVFIEVADGLETARREARRAPAATDLPAASGRQGNQPVVSPWTDGGLSVGSHLLTRLSVSCLSYLSANRGATGGQIATELGVRHPAQVGRVLERLQNRGLVSGRGEGRRRGWALTAPGREVLNQLQPVWRAQRPGAGDPALHPAESAALTALPERIHA